MHEYYLKDQQGNYITDQAGHPLPIDRLIHDVDEFGRLRPGASQYGPGGPSPIARPRVPYSPPLTRRRIAGSPGRIGGGNSGGFWNDIKTWWTGLKPEYRYGIFGGLAAIGVIIAACQKGEGKSSSVKRI